MVLGTPAARLIPRQPALAALSECDGALSGQRLLFGVTCQQKRGRAVTRSGGREFHPQTPPTRPQGGQAERESPARRKRLPSSSRKLTMWPVEGRAGGGNWG